MPDTSQAVCEGRYDRHDWTLRDGAIVCARCLKKHPYATLDPDVAEAIQRSIRDEVGAQLRAHLAREHDKRGGSTGVA